MIYPDIKFYNAQEAFVMMFDEINRFGVDMKNGTKAILNRGFYIMHPEDSDIKVEWRKWSKNYAMREWQWYLSKNRSVKDLKRYAPIWDKMHNGNNIVNSNYGYLWDEANQLDKCIAQLQDDPSTRQAWITIFDGKKKDEFAFDTPCTLSIGFNITNNRLNMNVNMRSNDLWYGFCNDQYCFSLLQQYVADKLCMPVGTYFHFVANLHIYKKHFNADYNFYHNKNKYNAYE